jgi:hypothetical protein
MFLTLLMLMVVPEAMTPSNLPCAITEARALSGRVMRYERSRAKTVIRIRTDARTFEDITLHHPKNGDPTLFFLINHQPFTRADWRRLEARKGMLWPAMRAHVWICGSGDVIIDWQPDEAALVVK